MVLTHLFCTDVRWVHSFVCADSSSTPHRFHSSVCFICGFRSCVLSPTVNWSPWVLWSQGFPHHRINAVETIDHRCWIMLHIVVIRRGHYKQSSFRQNRNIVHLILKIVSIGMKGKNPGYISFINIKFLFLVLWSIVPKTLEKYKRHK